MITRVSEGDTSAYVFAIGRVFVQNATFSYGMHYAVQCQEEMAFTDYATIQAEYAAQPDLQSLVSAGVTGEPDFELCEQFNAGSPLSIANDPVMSDIPALIFGGRFDPITPPEWGLLVHENLSNSTFLEIPTGGHGTTAEQSCPQSITAEFFINPTESPNSECINDMMLRFNGTLEEQDFIPVLLSDYGMMAATVIPSSWQEHERIAGLFLRNENPFDVTLIQFSTVESIDDVEALRLSVLASFDMNVSTYAGRVETDFTNWRLYRISSQGNGGFAAISIYEHTGYVVLLLGTDHEKNRILIPVLEGFTHQQ
jgi:hypothetical protein